MLENKPSEENLGRRNSRHDDQAPFARRVGLYLGVAFELPGTIIGGLVVGYFLDDYLRTSPWLLIATTTLACVGAFVRLIRWAKFFARTRNGDDGQKNDTED
jgi:F0F1-type ATP synthase assembly protein I